MQSFLFFLIGGLCGYQLAKHKMNIYVSIDNIRKGVRNKWYNAAVVSAENGYFVHLTGKSADGEDFSGYYPITVGTYYSLIEQDGLQVEEKDYVG